MSNEYRTLIWGALLLAAFMLGTRTGGGSAEVAEWRSAAGLANRAQRPFKDSVGKLLAKERAGVKIIRDIRTQVESVLVQTPRDSIPESVLLVLAQQTQALDQCEAVITTCQTRAAFAEARVDSLDTLLRKGLVVTKCKILLVPCPSRGLAFVGGGLAGVLLSGALK